MAVSVTHATAADGTFSASGTTAWDEAHTVAGLGTMAEQDADSVAITGGAVDGATVGATTAAAGTFTTLIATTTPTTLGNGSAATHVLASNLSGASDPQIAFSNAQLAFGVSGTTYAYFAADGLRLSNNGDACIGRAASNSLVFAAFPPQAGSVTSRTEINKTVTGITDAAATATFTVTIPNAAHTATIEFELTGIIGAGGAIGAHEAAATTSGKIIVTRTAGVNAVASAVSTAFGAVAANVAGATTVTVAAAVSAISGAVGATNTFTINVTITKAGGSSANHICLCYAKVMNANASGVTIA
jgi:hypothetical protein